MKTALPPILETKLADFRRRVWVVKLAEGIFAAAFGILFSYLLVFALDRFFETAAWVRLGLLLAGGAVLGLGLPLKWHQWVWRQRRLEDAARLLRRTFPRLGDQLLGLVELARMDHVAAGRSERLVRAAMEQAAESVKNQDFRKAVPDARHRQWGYAAAGSVIVVLLAFGLVNEAARNALARWIAPWWNIDRYTFTRVEPLPSRLVVPYAEPFELPVRLAGNTGQRPGEATAQIVRQPAVRAPLADGIYSLAFPPQKQDASLFFSVGDVRKTILVQPRPRPELMELMVRLRLPGYLEYRSEPCLSINGGSVSILRGAEAAFEARASRELARAELDTVTQRVEADRVLTGFLPVAETADRRFMWEDHDGLSPREPFVLKVRAVEDEAPKIVARRETLEQVVLESEVVLFDLASSDDFGVKRLGLSWTGALQQEDGTTPVRGEKVAAAGEPEEKELAARATFCANREGVRPQTLEVRAWAEDYLPGRTRAHSAAFVLHILDKTDHAIWLTQQFGKWLEAARETYEREQQLHQTNKELRALSAAELDRPENRRRVAHQAAAENANAARLASLTQSGRNLVEQATKNDEFDAARLESWATMLKSLKEIAANRMPSVSDLLKQTASAPAGKSGGANPAGSPPTTERAGRNGESAPGISQGTTPSNGPAQASALDLSAPAQPPAPSVSDREPGFGDPAERKPADPNAAPKPPGSGKLGLPATVLGAAPGKRQEEAAKPPESPAQEKLDHAVAEQRDLLAEFAKVSDQLSEILASLEASTFVKRFKAASRQQMAIATKINQQTLDAFGIESEPVKAAEPIVKQARDQSEIVGVIQSDLEAYFQRKQDSRFKKILDEMRTVEIVRALAQDGEQIAVNLTGRSMNASEFWADTLDRWGEELVAASNCKSCSTCSADSLPPEIVLKVMQALRDEMKLRDETREAEKARPALAYEKFAADANTLGDKQEAIRNHTRGATDDIRALPDGASRFSKELGLLTAVVGVMDEARSILITPETGPAAIAAETEAIELLLQAKRSGSGGGGGGSSPGGGGRAASASSAALADFGSGADAETVVAARPVGQATGKAGKEFPEEFKTGLDAYFSLLEEKGGAP